MVRAASKGKRPAASRGLIRGGCASKIPLSKQDTMTLFRDDTESEKSEEEKEVTYYIDRN